MRSMSRAIRFALLALAGLLAACSSSEPTTPTEPPAPTTPQPPASVTVTATSALTARVTWAAVTGATGYNVQRAQSTGSFESLGVISGTTLEDSGLNPSTQYRYRVATVVGATTSGYSAEATVTTPAATQPVVEVTADITSSTTWTADKLYILKGFIHVANGATLTIQTGTKIVGDFNTVGSSLFIMRGARIIAQGTEANPIVFTSSRAPGQRQAGDWGGLVLIGNGIINRAGPVIIEGTGTGPTNPAIDYAGGTNNADNSGILRYVRIEFAGYATAADQELNSLTLAAVGSGTEVSHVQVLNGLDDSFEWFGGAVDARYLVSYNSGDDHFDASEGYSGRVQYAIGYQTRTVIPRPAAGNVSTDPQGVENDGCNGAGCTAGQNSTPLTLPMFANFTLVGPPSSVTNSSGNIGMMLRRGTGGFYLNSVVARWSRAGLSLRDQTTLDRVGQENLFLRNLLVAESPVVCQAQSGTTVQGCVDLAANGITSALATSATSLFASLPAAEPTSASQLDWTAAAGSAAATGSLDTFTGKIAEKASGFVFPTTFRGAGASTFPKWWEGWTVFAVN